MGLLCALAFDTVVRDVSSTRDIAYWENLVNYLTGDPNFALDYADYLHEKHTPLRRRRWCYRLLITIVVYMCASTIMGPCTCDMPRLASSPSNMVS